MKSDFYLDVYTILNRIQLTKWTICAYRVLNPRQWFIAKQRNSKSWRVMPQKCKIKLKASAHSFKQFTSRLSKLSFSLSMHIYNSDGRHAWFHLHGTSRPDRSASEATKYKMKNSLSTVGLEPSTLRFQVWRSTYWASRAWWMLSV